jgi:ATP-dependent DNA helicase DinG
MPAVPLPAIHASHAGTWLSSADGPTRAIGKGDAIVAAADTPLLILNAPLVATRLGYPDLSGLDLLELFAFIHPARFCVPTPKGLAHALGLPEPGSDDAVPALLQQAAGALLERCESGDWPEREGAWSALQSLARLRWPWAPVLAPHVRKPERAEKWLFASLPEWEEAPERPQPAQVEIVRRRDRGPPGELTGAGAERREGQRSYAREAGPRVRPARARGVPHMLLAQAGHRDRQDARLPRPRLAVGRQVAGHGVGLDVHQEPAAPAAPRKPPRVARARADGSRPVVVRKGRENYLCLLNLEDALQGGFGGRAAILAQLVARWAAYSQDGDMIGGDMPGWLGTLFRNRAIRSLTDQRGECVYAGCPHYRKCFIERATRASAQADLVIANHALVMVNAARGRDGPAARRGSCSTRATTCSRPADSTFAAALTGQEAIELKRWIVGPEKGSRGRRRGLAARLADVASYDEAGGKAIAQAREAAEALPGDGWLARLAEGNPFGPGRGAARRGARVTYARDESGGQEAGYGIETEAAQLDGNFVELAQQAGDGARRDPPAADPARRAARGAGRGRPDWLDGAGRARIEGRAPFARLADRHARRVGSAARPARRAGRSRFRRLARGRALRRARVRRRAAPALPRSDEAVRQSRARAGARRHADQRDACATGEDWRPRSPARARCTSTASPISPAPRVRSTTPAAPRC